MEEVEPINFTEIEKSNRAWMVNALNYKNSRRGMDGKEDQKSKWFEDIDGLDWTRPFFRHVDGKDHTHLFIDVDVRVAAKVRKQYTKFPDRLRALQIEACVEFFRNWQAEHTAHQFFWKVSGNGLHGIQRIGHRIDRCELIPVLLYLFPPCSSADVKMEGERNQIVVNPFKYGDTLRNHIPKASDDGWCLDYDVKEKKYNKLNWIRYWRYKDITFKIIIDLNFFYNEKRIVRWTYSPYLKIPGRIYYSAPIKVWNVDVVLHSTTAEGLVIEPYNIPDFSFSDMVKLKQDVDDVLWMRRTVRDRQVGGARYSPLQVPGLLPVGAEIPAKMYTMFIRMEERLEADVDITAPCMRYHWFNKDRHWSKFQIGRFLQAHDYTPSDIANFFRFRINNDEDNLPENRGRLLEYMPYVLGSAENKHKLPSCSVLQTPSGEFFCCTEKMQQRCGRRHPLSRYTPSSVSNVIADVKIDRRFRGKNVRHYWKKIKDLLRDAFAMDDNLVIWKSTRAGVTTTVISIAKEVNKRILVVVPTNRIAEKTFFDALKIVKDDNGKVVNGAILASNRKGCLLLNFVERDLENMKLESPEWGETGIAWKKLRYHSKKDCQKCPHRNAQVAIPIIDKEGYPEPLYKSSIVDYDRKTGQCAYTTFRKQISGLDVVFVTYSKLYSLMMNVNEDTEALKEDLFNNFDIIMLDEVSTFANTSPLDLNILQNPIALQRMDSQAEHDIFQQIRDEIDKLAEFSTARITLYIDEIAQHFISGFEFFKLRAWDDKNYIAVIGDSETIDDLDHVVHPLSYIERVELRESFFKIHGLLENLAMTDNVSFPVLEQVIMLMGEDSWIATSTPTPDRLIDLRFVAAPRTGEVKAFVRQFADGGLGKRVFVTDACMPEVNMGEFFDIPFTDFTVGDPRETNKQQIIIHDSRKITATSFTMGHQCTHEECPYGLWSDGRCVDVIKFVGLNKEKGYELEDMVSSSYYKDRCYHWRSEFIRMGRSMAQAFGADNIIVIVPNKRVFHAIRRIQAIQLFPRRVDLTYYRSDRTLGVPCDKRIMLCLGLPFTPLGSHLWLAHYYHRDNLMLDYTLSELGNILRINSIKQSFWQTIGRAKSPKGTKASTVMLWGVNMAQLESMYHINKDKMLDDLPEVPSAPQRGMGLAMKIRYIRFYRTFKKMPSGDLIKLSELAMSSRFAGKWMTASDITRYSNISSYQIDEIVRECDDQMFLYLGLETQFKRRAGRINVAIRSVHINDEKLYIDDL